MFPVLGPKAKNNVCMMKGVAASLGNAISCIVSAVMGIISF